MSTVQGPTVVFGAEFPGLAQGAGEFDKIRKGAERARDEFGRFIKAGTQAAPALRKVGDQAAQGLGGAANAAGEAVKALAEIPPTLDVMLKSIDKTNDGFKDFGSGFNKKADEIGRKLDSSTEGIDRLRQSVDATVDPLRLFGKRGIDLANAIDDIPDPARRSALALKLLKEQANPGAMEKINRKWANFNSEMELLRVRAGVLLPVFSSMVAGIGNVVRAAIAAAAAIAVGFVGGLAAGFKLALEGNKKLKATFDGLERSAKKFVSTAAQIVIGLIGIDTHAKDATTAIDSITKAMVDNQSTVRVFAATLLEAAADIGQQLANMGMVIRIALFDIPRFVFRGFQVMADAIPGIFHRVRAEILETMARLVLEVALLAKKAGADDLAMKLREVWEGTRNAAIAADQAAKGYGASIGQTGAKIDAEFQDLKDTLSEIDSFAERARTRARDIRLGNVEDVTGIDTSGLDEKEKAERKRKAAKEKEAKEIAAHLIPGVLGGLALLDKLVTERFEKMRMKAKTMAQEWLDGYGGGGLAEIGKRNAEALASMDAQAMVMDAQFANLASGGLSIAVDGFMNLAGAIGTAFGEMIVGTQTLEGFGRALVGVVADMANQFGSLFLLIGTGLAFIPGMGGWSAGLIGAGIGLKALGAGLGAVASGEVGGRGSSRGSGGGGATIDPSRFLRPERSMEPSVTNLKVVILGEEIEKPVTRFMDDVARRGGFRNLATRT